MSKEMVRREFLLASTLTAAGLLVRVPASLAADSAGPAMKAKDPAHMSLLEQKHVPVIEVPGHLVKGVAFPVSVTIGEVIHPMVKEHYIEYVELLVNGESAGKMLLHPVINAPKATFFITLDGSATLTVRELCNIHGLWENSLDVSVS